MNEIETINKIKNLTPFKLSVIDNFPFIEADFDAITEYELLCLVVKYLNSVIDNENKLNDAMKEVGEGFIALYNYVHDYFDNLDVQDEINNKLNEMTINGTLQEIISSYLNSKAIFGFDNVESMKNATNLINGSYAKTLGYYNKNDGGAGLYKIRNITNDDVVDNAKIIGLLDDNLIAELIISNYVNVKQFGAKGDNVTDDTLYIQKALDLYNKIYIPEGTYMISNLKLKNGQELFGIYGKTILKSISENTNSNLIETLNNANKVYIHDISFNGDLRVDTTLNLIRASGIQNGLFDCKHIITNVEVMYGNTNCLLVGDNVRESKFTNLDIRNGNGYGVRISGTDNMFVDLSVHSNKRDGCYITGSNNKIVNSKFYINGLSDEYDNRLPAGLTILGKVNVITGCEIQENIYDGIKLIGYMNTITGCLIDSNGSNAYSYQYAESAGIHIMNNNVSRQQPTAFNMIIGNTISSHHVTGMQKYGILIENIKAPNSHEYRNNPSYNIINCIVESDKLNVDGIKTSLKMFENDIPNISNNVIINGNDLYKYITIKDLSGLTEGTYSSSNLLTCTSTLLNNRDLIMECTNNSSPNGSSIYKTYKLFNNNQPDSDIGRPKGLIVKFKAKTSNNKVTARCNIDMVYYNDETYTTTTSVHNIRETYLSQTLSSEFVDCVSILDLRQYNLPLLKDLYIYFGGHLENDIGNTNFNLEFKDIEYYLFY